MNMIALIPARSGSTRLPGKNIRRLAGVPLIAYTIAAAKESGIFDQVVVSTDSDDYGEIAQAWGADYWIQRESEHATATSPDIEWVNAAAEIVGDFDAFSILRPTSPFRTADTIRRAYRQFCEMDPKHWDSLRAIELCSQHPRKMWFLSHFDGPGDAKKQWLTPVLDSSIYSQAWNRPTQTLGDVYVQNASLEMAHRHVLPNSISGTCIAPFFTEGREGFDINSEDDWLLAELLVQMGTPLPEVGVRS